MARFFLPEDRFFAGFDFHRMNGFRGFFMGGWSGRMPPSGFGIELRIRDGFPYRIDWGSGRGCGFIFPISFLR